MIAKTLFQSPVEIHTRKVDAGGTVLHTVLRFASTLMLAFFAWSSAVAVEPMRLALAMSPLALPFYVAQDQGYFAAEGVSIKINETPGGVRAMENLLAGSADLATTSETVVMFNSFKSNDFAVIASFAISDNDLKILSRPGSGIDDVRQLTGKRVGNIGGSASHYYLDLQLVLRGVDPASVKLINLQPGAMGTALEKGDVDAVAIWEPYAFLTSKALPDAKVLPTTKGYDLRFNLIAHKRLMGARDDDLVKLLRALDRANKFIVAESAKAQAILKQHLKLEQAFVDWVWPTYKYRLALEQSLIKSLEGQARWARQGGHISSERSPNYLHYLYPGPLRHVRPTAVSVME